MGRYFTKFSYIGTLYRGAQKHTHGNIIDADSVQGAIETALATLVPKPIERPKLVLSSRTDAGVHALCTAGHILLKNKYNTLYDSDAVLSHVNRSLLKYHHFIRLLEFIPVTDNFHARHLAKSRTYIYRFMRPKKHDEHRIPILEMRHAFQVRAEVFNIQRIEKGLELFMGKKNFMTFAARSKTKHKIQFERSLNSLTIEKVQPLMPFDQLSDLFDYWHIKVNGKSFLYNQVRRIAGALVTLGSGKITERDIEIMLQVPSHNNWDTRILTLPPNGLHLLNVEYDLVELKQYIVKEESNELKSEKTLEVQICI